MEQGRGVPPSWEELSHYDLLKLQVPDHPPTDQCPDLECMVCSVRDCPHGEPLHYHHDGCPVCFFEGKQTDKVWTCKCGYMNNGPVCTHCGRVPSPGE